MTDAESPTAVERALAAHDAFEPRTDDGYDLTTTVFDVVVTAPEDASVTVDAEATLPTLDAAVAGETVAAAVEDGWFETLERRLQDVFRVARSADDGTLTVDRDDEAGEVRVGLAFEATDAGEAVEDTKALIEYVEGTFVQGIVPGYEYRGPAGELLDRARQLGRDASQGDDADTPL